MKIVIFDADSACEETFVKGLEGHDVCCVEGPVTAEGLSAHSDAEVVSLFVSSELRQEGIDLLPNLKCIAARSTGVDNVDATYAESKGIVVMNVPHYGAETVGEFVFALMLSLSRHIPQAVLQVREEGSFDTSKLEGFNLFGRTLGVVGTGAIGRVVVRIAQGFGMTVRMFDKFPNKSLESETATYVSLEQLLSESDVITLHVPYVPENHHLLGAAQFAQMKKGVYVINTARGELVDTDALIAALVDGTVARAALDVLEGERNLKDEVELMHGTAALGTFKEVLGDHVLMRMPQVLVTPHIAFFSKEAYKEILDTSAANIAAFLAGSPQNVIQP